jgi:predicted nucleic acid-binding Zn ribbon protein
VEPLNRTLNDVVHSLLTRSPMSDGKVEFAWRVAVGASLERVTHPQLLDDGTVEVRVDDPAWRKEVKRAQPLILSKLRSLLGTSVVRKIRVVGGGR